MFDEHPDLFSMRQARLDLREDDPCHGCKWAVPLDDSELNGYFDRRYACMNIGRVAHYLDEVKWRVDNGSMQYLRGARELADKILEMIEDFERKGHCKCVESIVPSCFETGKGA